MIVAAGLGPAGPGLIPQTTWDWVKRAPEIYLRTELHPAVQGLTERGVSFHSFDDLYEEAESWEQLYSDMAEFLLERAQKVAPVLYLVPGSPLVAESSVDRLREAARGRGTQLQIEIAPSFLDLTYRALELDPTAGLQVLDAYEIVDGRCPWPEAPLVISQVHSRLIAGELKLALLELLDPHHPVTVLRHLGLEEEISEMPLQEIDRIDHDHLTTLYLPAEQPGGGQVGLLARSFYRVMKALIGEGGCPWDRKQTHRSLRPFLLEETHEALQAIEQGNPERLAEELGDVLLQVFLHGVIAEKNEDFALSDVIGGITEKMIRRHPHVFGQVVVSGADEVLSNWEAIKKEEKGDRGPSLTDGLPPRLPALLQALKVQQRASRLGFDWPDDEGPRAKVREESKELEVAGDARSRERELGDLLFSVVNWARFLKVDPESALRGAVARFASRWSEMSDLAQQRNLRMDEMTLDELDRLWEEAKENG